MSALSDDDSGVRVPIDGVLDLHLFQPREAADLVETYLQECRAAGILQVRIIHGKGTGILRRTVEELLRRLDMVQGFRLAGPGGGDWGATLVELAPHEIISP